MSKKRPTSSASASVATSKGHALNVIQDEDEFSFPTGDKYVGSFQAKKKEKTVKMHGFGTYTSSQGDSYTGIWDNDCLSNEEVANITYPDNSRYEGTLKNFKYAGEGKITYPDGSELVGKFSNNCPEGELSLRDPNGHIWIGVADKGFAWFHPMNHYYDFLESRPTKKLK